MPVCLSSYRRNEINRFFSFLVSEFKFGKVKNTNMEKCKTNRRSSTEELFPFPIPADKALASSHLALHKTHLSSHQCWDTSLQVHKNSWGVSHLHPTDFSPYSSINQNHPLICPTGDTYLLFLSLLLVFIFVFVFVFLWAAIFVFGFLLVFVFLFRGIFVLTARQECTFGDTWSNVTNTLNPLW